MSKPPCLCADRGVRCDTEVCDLAPHGQPYDSGRHCKVCWLYFHSLDYNLAWGGNGNVSPDPGSVSPTPRRSSLPCVHLGPATGERVACSTCPGSVKLKVHHCTIHSRAVMGETRANLPQGCLDCPDRSVVAFTPDAARTRHLLFHLYPLRSGAAVWRWHAEQLRRHVSLFNGRRILALALDGATEDAGTVRDVFAGIFDEILEFPNDPALREVATFEPLFARVSSMDPTEAVLWAHGKGTGRHAHPQVQRWTELLYEMNLEHFPEVQELLQRFPIVGSFKKVGQGWPSHESLSDWHYSGSWFWVRSRDLFGQTDWRRIDRFWSGIESYPSLHFSPEQAGCLFFEFPVDPARQLYQAEFWAHTVEPAYQEWRARQTPVPADGLKVEIGGGEHPRGEGFIDVDRSTGIDLETDRLPFEDDAVAEVYSAHTFEHIKNLHHLLHEVVRICKVGARVEIRVPHWLSPMALCHDHKQVIPPEQVEHWTKTALDYWWRGCTKRLQHIRTEQVPSGRIAEARRLFPGWTDEQLMSWVPGAAHEVRYTLRVVPHEE